MSDLDYEKLCPGCNIAVGDHTIRRYAQCLQTAGFDYQLPFEDVAGGPIQYPNVEGRVVGEITVGAGYITSAVGRLPLLRFVFTGPGTGPMERRNLPPINLVMDANGLRGVRTIVSSAIDRAILGARRGR